RIVVIDRHRVAHAELLYRAAHVRLVLLEGKLRRVHADDDESAILVTLVPGLQVRQRTQAVDAGVGPEVDQYDLAAQTLPREWRGIEPGDCATQGRQLPLNRRPGNRRPGHAAVYR